MDRRSVELGVSQSERCKAGRPVDVEGHRSFMLQIVGHPRYQDKSSRSPLVSPVSGNDDGAIRGSGYTVRARRKEREGKTENGREMDQSYDGLDRSIGTIGFTDRIPTRPYECPTAAWQREKK